MLQSTINNNLIPNQDIDLKKLLDEHGRSLMLQMNCHHIGVVESFDSSSQTATVRIPYKKTIFKTNNMGQTVATLVDYPLLVKAPVRFESGGGFSLTYPLEKGDECSVFFNDRDIDNWYAGLNNAAVATPRLHAFSDAFIYPGLKSKKRAIAEFSTAGISIRNKDGTQSVTVKKDAVVVKSGNAEVTTNTDGVKVALGSTMTVVINPDGKFSFTNGTGEFLTALIEALSTATAGGFPLVIDPSKMSIIQSFKV
jgi:hypothetical protein